MNRYESNLKNVSPVIEDLRNEFSRSPRGVHDLSYQADFDASDGWIIPIDYHEHHEENGKIHFSNLQ